MNNTKELRKPITEKFYHTTVSSFYKTPDQYKYIHLMNMQIDENILTSNMKFKRVDDIAGYPCYTDGRYEISETEYGFIVHPDKDRILKKVKDFIKISDPDAFFLIV